MQLYIECEKVIIKPIDVNSVNMVKLWYHQWDSYGYATGGKKTDEAWSTRLNSFVSGIYTKNETIIGLITGELKRIKENVLWIRTFLIDAAWQRKQFGTYSFNLVCNHTAEYLNVKRVYLSVSEENTAGINFWRKMGMTCVKTIGGKDPGNNRGILIFEKVL